MDQREVDVDKRKSPREKNLPGALSAAWEVGERPPEMSDQGVGSNEVVVAVMSRATRTHAGICAAVKATKNCDVAMWNE